MARCTEVLAVEAGTLRERTAAQAEPIAELRAQRELHNASERATQAAPAVIGALAPREPATVPSALCEALTAIPCRTPGTLIPTCPPLSDFVPCPLERAVALWG